MSTRSGKRLHSSKLEDAVENDIEIKTARKTRNKRSKENIEELQATEKKKKHFVRYPSEEDVTINATVECVAKSTRKSRKNTLKELNLQTDSETSNDERKAVRLTRRTKIIEEIVEPENVDPSIDQNHDEEGKKAAKKKKKGKNKMIECEVESVPIVKKKSNKKKNKKRSNPIIVEDITCDKQGNLNKSNASVDSFHSAAGSPVLDDGRMDVEEPDDCANALSECVNSNQSFEKENKKKRKPTSERNSSLVCDANNKISINENMRTEEVANQMSAEATVYNTFEKLDKRKSNQDDLDTSFKKTRKTRQSMKLDIENSNNSNENSETCRENMESSDVKDVVLNNNSGSLKKKKKSEIKDSDDKINTSLTKLNSTLDKESSERFNISGEEGDTYVKTVVLDNNSGSLKKKRISEIKDSTYDKINTSLTKLNSTFDKESSERFNISGKEGDTATEVLNNTIGSNSKKKRKSSIKNSTYDKIDNLSAINLDGTFEKSCSEQNTLKNIIHTNDKDEKRKISTRTSFVQDEPTTLNSTYDKVSTSTSANTTFEKPAIQDTTFDKPAKRDTTFDKDKDISLPKHSPKTRQSSHSKSSLISSDTTDNMTSDLSENSRLSITSDDSKAENIINTTPVLIESSMDDSCINITDSPKSDHKENVSESKLVTPEKNNKSSEKNNQTTPLRREGTFTEANPTVTPLKRDGTYTELKPTTTPMKREGTFTKDSSDLTESPKPKASLEKTPTRRKSMPSPGRTPFPLTKSSSKEKSLLNVTRSIEKPRTRRSSLVEAAPRMTKVMFCSPVNNPAVVTQMKGRVIKSNLKGSNKSFVFDESVSEPKAEQEPRGARKRSFTQSEVEDTRSKRQRLQHTGERTRSRTSSATARLQDQTTPSKKPLTPSKSKPESKVARTKLPNFAALHQKQFEKMESLDECQERKAKRARQLLTPTGAITVLERTSPKETQPEQTQPAPNPPAKKTETPTKSKPPIETNKGYSRFGFKLNMDVNPFSVTAKGTDAKPKESRVTQATLPSLKRQATLPPLQRQATLPSLAGATALRREAAKQAVMREKSFTEKRDVSRKETRTVIKGVRTNRRFELQMKMRNING